MTDTTQPPAETLANQMLIAELRKLYRGLEMSAGLMRDRKRTGGWSGAERTADAFARYAATAQSLHALVSASAALTGRAGGDAIPAGEACTCQRFPTHQANDCPAHGLEAPFDGVPHDDAARTVVATVDRPQMTEAEARDMLLHNNDAAIIQVMRDRGFIGDTPKPPAGGDAGAVERLADALRSVRDDLHNENGLNLHAIADTIWHSPAETTVDFIDSTLAALALPAPVVEGWQPIETAILWDVYIVTDGEHVALAQYAESDWGGNYWAVDPEDALEWSPTHCITPPAALSEGRSHG